MTVPNFLALCAAVFALGYVAVRIYDESHPVALRTVEQEQDESRAVIRLVGQHHPSEPEEYMELDDPICLMVHEITMQHQAQM